MEEQAPYFPISEPPIKNYKFLNDLYVALRPIHIQAKD